MSFLAAIPIIGKVLDGAINLIDQFVEDKDEANKIKATLTEVFNKSDMTKFSEQIQAQAKVIVAETQSQSWLARSWRPILMLSFTAIIVNNYILNPWLSALFSVDVVMEIPESMWGLLKLGVGGYIVGRSAEKGIELWKEKP